MAATLQKLQMHTPGLLQTPLPSAMLARDVVLRVLPHHRWPVQVRGRWQAHWTLRLLQRTLTTFFLNPRCQLHITDLKLEQPVQNPHALSDELIDANIANNAEMDGLTLDGASHYTTKVKIKWRTCFPECEHLNGPNNKARLGQYSLDWFKKNKPNPKSHPIQTMALEEAKKTLESVSEKIKSLEETISPPDGDVGRIITGIFIFELDANNELVKVFTIENIEVLESKDLVGSDNLSAV